MPLKDQLDELVTTYGLSVVLARLADVCNAKSTSAIILQDTGAGRGWLLYRDSLNELASTKYERQRP